jgi:hypothetical protein
MAPGQTDVGDSEKVSLQAAKWKISKKTKSQFHILIHDYPEWRKSMSNNESEFTIKK